MPAHSPTQPPAYNLPDGEAIGAAVDAVLIEEQGDRQRLGRVMLVVLAAAVRDILTNCEPGAGFDAAHAELVQGADGELSLTGRYWTGGWEELTFATTPGVEDAEVGLHDVTEWTQYLDESTAPTWRPVCTALPSRGGRPAYRVDLGLAATLPLD
ncbi:hypothetical protein [Streptomyces sp. NRRL S-350]|uniref:hypothetical protein n=1 Tax=Streptomyces sp. NRRL S-350 TaxID=1463902 RepID=UPI0004C20F7A|nr:hypothetical protein [Streptomyces sp. NRRL S-350]